MSRKGQAGLVALQAWLLLRRQKRRRQDAAGQEESSLPVLAHHPHGGLPGDALVDDIYLAENAGALSTDSVEIWVLDPSVVTIEHYPPTEVEWQAAIMDSLVYNAGSGGWHYENPEVGQTKEDGDSAWIRGRFRRAGEVPGPWSVVDYPSGAGMVSWGY